MTDSSNMSDLEIEQAIRDAEQHAAEDAQLHHESEVRSRADQLIVQAQTQEKKKLDKELKAQLASAMKDTKKALRGKDLDLISSASDRLEQVLQNIGA